jgi:hypothetical protein
LLINFSYTQHKFWTNTCLKFYFFNYYKFVLNEKNPFNYLPSPGTRVTLTLLSGVAIGAALLLTTDVTAGGA